MRNRKFIGSILAGCLLLVGASFGITYAYIFSNDSKVNEFTVGENEIEIEEEFDPPDDLTTCDSFTKAVRIKNTGNIDCYVRVRVEFSDTQAADLCTIDYYSDNDLLNGNEPWFEAEDGYYYYKTPLKPYSEDHNDWITSLLFDDKILFDSSEENQDKIINFDIMVYAESCDARDAEGNLLSLADAWNNVSLEVKQ